MWLNLFAVYDSNINPYKSSFYNKIKQLKLKKIIEIYGGMTSNPIP
jgi:hypothetical protein